MLAFEVSVNKRVSSDVQAAQKLRSAHAVTVDTHKVSSIIESGAKY